MYGAEAYSEPCQSSKTEGSYQSSKAEVFLQKQLTASTILDVCYDFHTNIAWFLRF